MVTQSSSYYLILDGQNPKFALNESNNVLSVISPGIVFERKPVYPLLHLIYFNKNYKEVLPIWQSFSRMVALTKKIGYLLVLYEIDYSLSFNEILEDFLKELTIIKWQDHLDNKFDFKLIFKKKGNYIDNPIFFLKKNRKCLKLSVAEKILNLSMCSVNLKDPFYELDLILLPNYIILGLRLFEPNRKYIKNRAPALRYFFHPASMNPILIRAMLNSGITKYFMKNVNKKKKSSERQVFLDPFMGGGGMLIEAGILGFLTIGLDIGYWMCRGSRMNLYDLSSHNIDLFPWTIIRINSEFIPVKDNSVDLIVTDPPYGISTSLKNWSNLETLLNTVLGECYRVLKPESRIVISVPSKTNMIIEKTGFKLIIKNYDRVHKSLTRVIYVLEKPLKDK
ncbi:MAG: TRM11 family SAM-dependent methyltransferase [Candidatus Hodarchaeales archaeon]|jgi:putative methyltransferase (TIGR01177 family)